MDNRPNTADSTNSDLRLTTISASCTGGSCPTIYQSDRGTLVVQGYAVSAARAGVNLPTGELLVEIPVELLTNAARNVS
ncbi:hypothetical protein DFJ67_5893 [Asanoa ferruginea]|uniref:Uncharacterized protein n=1 Tax=Asanoa ferruginea TaxID=53367 RepID=A0A3D9ZSI0_9ACTN|nr:hypothetical protein [Asanoa ferruginea]REF99849.1 hypothetical protein DFJ67_5893 [Asanoa ferruginea]GIF52672.1 hypothetical protein Afe04nite_72110 [Asanoa ferruginea]